MSVFTAILKGVLNARTFEMNQIEEVTTKIHRKVKYLKTIIENYDAEIRGNPSKHLRYSKDDLQCLGLIIYDGSFWSTTVLHQGLE